MFPCFNFYINYLSFFGLHIMFLVCEFFMKLKNGRTHTTLNLHKLSHGTGGLNIDFSLLSGNHYYSCLAADWKKY